MKILLKICLLIFILINVAACSYDSKNFQNIDKHEVSSEIQKISSEDRELIEEYNKIFDSLKNGNDDSYHQKLKAFLSKAQLITDDKERNNIFMNIFMQLNMNKEAYELNEKLIIEKPTVSRFLFRCQLMDLLENDKKSLQQCHAVAGNEIFKVLDKNSPTFQYDELAYFIEMYKAGDKKYGDKIKNSINAVKDETMRSRFLSIYEEIVK